MTLTACIATSIWLYRTDRIAHAWNPSPPWGPSYAGVIRSDGVGYFAWTYSLATQDFCFAPYIAESVNIQSAAASGFHLETGNGCFLPQYSMGQGALWTPMVVASRGLYKALGKTSETTWITPASGVGILLGSALLAAIGVAAIVAFCRRRMPTWLALIAAGTTFVGMYGFHYATFDAEFSHATSFGLFGVFIVLVDKVRRSYLSRAGSTLAAIALGFDIGLIGLVRIPNLAIVAVYLLVAFWAPTRDALAGRPGARMLGRALALVGAAALVTLATQSLMWFLASGRWLPNTYVGSGFIVSSETPVIFGRLLFDPTWHGTVIWSPILLISVLGLIFGWRAFGYAAIGAGLTIATMLVTSSTWSYPTGGGGIGLRFLVDIAPFVAIGVACALRKAYTQYERIILGAIIAVTLLVAAWSGLAMLGYWSARFPITGAPLHDVIDVITSPRLF